MKSREALLWMALFAEAALLTMTYVHTGDRLRKVERELATLPPALTFSNPEQACKVIRSGCQAIPSTTGFYCWQEIKQEEIQK